MAGHAATQQAPVPTPRELLDQEPFLLFGFGPARRKYLYRQGKLCDACTGQIVQRWRPVEERLEPETQRVTVFTDDGETVIGEDAEGIWIRNGNDERVLSASPVKLPQFEGHPHAALLRALHHEVLVNIMPFGPVPNLLAYSRPWYRDAAMMLMVLSATGNLKLVEPWAAGLHQVYDRNNAGEAEADNLGQLLYIASLFESGEKHPIVEKVLQAARAFEKGGRKDRHIAGRSDFAEHPVYQTKWMKFGLQCLGLDDPYTIPTVRDEYSSLVWWDFRDEHVECARFGVETGLNYPYLKWAEAHFYTEQPPMELLGSGAPLTWEAKASQADYWRMRTVSSSYTKLRMAAPHTWHAAEAFLYLLELETP